MMKEMKLGVFSYDGNTYNFNFTTSLSAYEKMVFVKTVVKSIIDEDGYDAIIRDLIFDFVIIDVFTNIDTSFINMKDDEGNDINPIIPIEHFLEETNVVDIVKSNMESGLIDELNRAIDLNIQYLTGICVNSLNSALANLVNTIEDKIDEYDLSSVMGMVQKFVDMSEDFTVENAINAYMNSDIHKKNVEEIEKIKNK